MLNLQNIINPKWTDKESFKLIGLFKKNPESWEVNKREKKNPKERVSRLNYEKFLVYISKEFKYKFHGIF